ncbi:hypothetical protein FRC04_007995 [Tulasnella sp. 424]|nr:hypothetical protein FRC04_007995 [Tulasnella sp. 424]
MNLITALYRALGIPDEQMDQLMNAQSFPPHEGYELPIDAGKVRALIVGANGEDMPSSVHANPVPGPSNEGRRRPLDQATQERLRKLVHDGFIVAFSQPPAVGIPPPTMDRFGEPTPGSVARRQGGPRSSLSSSAAATPSAAARAFLNTAHRPPYSSLGTTMARTAVDLASRVFQANSVLIPTEFEGALRLWCGAMGWEPRAVNECAVPASSFMITPGSDVGGAESGGEGSSRAGSVVSVGGGRDQDRMDSRRKRKDIIPIVAPYSELDYHEAQRPKDMLAVGIAYHLFVGPATQAAMAAAGFGSMPIAGGASSTPFPFTFSALGNNQTQPNSPPLPNSPFGTHPNMTSQPTSPPPSHAAPPTTSSNSSSSSPPQHSLLTPGHILSHLPSKEWRSVLLSEFESFMIVHEGVSGPNRSLWRRRIERMFEWAEYFAELFASNGGAAGGQGDSGAESGSQVSSSSHSAGSIRAGKRKAKARSNAAMSTSGVGSGSGDGAPPPPPTMGLFAVACGVFAIGALSYACKAAHGFPEVPRTATSKDMEVDGGRATDKDDSEATVSVASSVAMPPPPALPFSVSFSLTGGGPGSVTPVVIPGASSTKPNPLIHSLPPSYSPHVLHSLQRATIIAHDHLDLPPSLDLLYAHVLGWLYLMHPSDSLSNVTNNGFDSSVRGVGGGAVTVVEPVIWKELGKCINIARGMGLGVVDDDGHGPEGREGRKIRRRKGSADDEDDRDREDSYAEKMGLWEREMRRRVWWELSWFDLWISDSMGHTPLISEDTSLSTRIPSDVDESSFDPTATSIPAPSSGAAPGANLAHFVAKCRLQLLMRDLPRAPIKDAVTGELSIDAAQAFEAKVTAWKESLPESFSIIFGPTVEETKWPVADVAAMQACDLHIMANALIMRLWFPFVKDFLGRSVQPHQNAALACSTAANSIIVASKYMITRFRTTHPLHFGYYGFGRHVWLAATLLASILISMPQIIWAATCRKGLDVALSIARDQLLAGKTENGANPKYEVIQLLQQLKHMSERFTSTAGAPTGSKRKAAEHSETVKLRHGFQIPYVGLSAVSGAGEIDLPLGRHESFNRSVSVNATPTRTIEPLPVEDMDVSAEPGPSRPAPLPMPRTSRSRTTSQTAWAESASHIVGGHNGEYVLPAAATSFPPSAGGRSGRGKPPSEVSQTSSLQGKSAPVTSKRSFPVIGIRDRTKTQAKQQQQQQQQDGSSAEKGRASASDVGPSRAKRPKSSSGRESTPGSGAPSPAGRTAHLQHTYPQPTPESAMAAPGVMIGSAPPPIIQTAPPQPTYYAQPSRHVHSTSMSDVGSQVSIGASQTQQYRQTGPGSDYSSAFSAGPRNPQPQDYSMSVPSQASSQASSAYQPAQTREYGLPMGQTYAVDDGLSTFSGPGSDYHASSVASSSTFHHGAGSAVGNMNYTNGGGDGQNYSGVSTPVPPQQQQQQQMQLMAQYQNSNSYGAHPQYQSQTPQPTPSQGGYAQFAEPGPPAPRGWTAEDTSGSQVNGSNLWNGPSSDSYVFGGSIA